MIGFLIVTSWQSKTEPAADYVSSLIEVFCSAAVLTDEDYEFVTLFPTDS